MKRPSSILLCFLVVAVLASEVGATGACGKQSNASRAKTMSLDTVLESVRASHPLLKAAQELKHQAAAEVLSAQGAFDTSLTVEMTSFVEGAYDGQMVDSEVSRLLETGGVRMFAGYRNTSGKIPSYDDELLTGEGGELRAGVRVPLSRDRAIDQARSQTIRASLQRAANAASLSQRRIELVRGASHAFLNWIAHGRRLDIQERLFQIATERTRQISERIEKGELAKIDLDENERLVLQRRANVLSAQRGLEKAAIELSLYFRDLDGKPKIVPRSELPPALCETEFTPQAMSDIQLENRPEVRRLLVEIERAEIERKLAANQRLPKVDLLFGVSNDLGRTDPVSGEAEAKVGLRFQLPLENREALGKIALTDSKSRELQSQLRFVREKIATEIRDAQNAISLARERHHTASKEERLAEDLRSAEDKKYRLGESNLLFVNLREQFVAEASIRVIEAFADFSAAIVELNAALGYEGEG